MSTSREVNKEVSRLAFVAAVSLLLVGCAASTSERNDREDARAVEQSAEAPANHAVADSLAAEGILLFRPKTPGGVSLLTRALESAPNRPDLLWLQAQVCHQTDACDPQPIEARLRRVDPSNGAGWLGALARATAAGDERGIDDAVRGMSQARRFDIYWTPLLYRLTGATSRDTGAPLPDALSAVMGHVTAAGIPAFAPITKACNGERLNRPDMLDACRKIAMALMRGDAIITEMVGVAMTKRVWPADSVAWKAADSARDRHQYQVDKTSGEEEMQDVSAATRYVSLLGQHRREQDLLRAKLIAAGIDPEPPAP